MVRLQQGNELLSSSFFGCLFQAVPLFMALMLVCRLQVSSYSTFLIILPVFIVLGCCCCVVFCGICCLSVMDMDGMNEELEKQRQAEQGGPNGANVEGGGDKEYTPPNPADVEAGNHTANPAAAYGTFAAPDANSKTTSSSAAVYAPPPPPVESPLTNTVPAPTPYVPTVTNIDTDID